VLECNVPLRFETARRVAALRKPWLLPLLASHLLRCWLLLWWRSRRVPFVDLVVVGYMGHFDVHLARLIWPKVPIVLDHLVSASGTAVDRGASGRLLLRVLRLLDRLALRRADLPVVDTVEHLGLVEPAVRERAVVVPVGAAEEWFADRRRKGGDDLRVIFFGSFTPLQGAPVIGEAIRILSEQEAPVRFTMVGRGQDFEATRQAAGDSAKVSWLDWVEPEDLPALVADHDVALGIFGTGLKAQRVVPTKVFQSAAAGVAVVTSGTQPQRDALGGCGVYVPSGDASALAAALTDLAGDRAKLAGLRRATTELALERFGPEPIVADLRRSALALIAA
jgi:glycosyltransferase involved in cell wall biosynthesis